jgi:predicted dehydrogenase
VIGVGYLGRHHARILSQLPDVHLVRVVDVNGERAAEIAAQTGTKSSSKLEDIFGEVDAVTVAVPTEAHLAVAKPFLERGVPALVEKPLARSLEEADEMIAVAKKSGALLSVGHTERHNPAVKAASALIHQPRFAEVHRLGTFPERSLDIDVVFDLMIHDLDVILSVVPSEVVAIDAVGIPVLTHRVDIANARLRFASGCVVNLTASRISRDRLRKMRLFQQDTYLSIDYAEQEVEMWRLVRTAGVRPNIEGGKLDVVRDEPLKLELADFVDAVRSRRAPVVTADQGRRALALAQQIVERMKTGS